MVRSHDSKMGLEKIESTTRFMHFDAMLRRNENSRGIAGGGVAWAAESARDNYII